MTATAENILAQAMALPDSDREELVERLCQSMPWDEPTGSGANEITEEQEAMLDQRWEEIESGKVSCRPVDALLEEMRAKYGL